jgi:acetyl-CoA decarbonylase/synthase complex subunit delta
MDVLDTRPDDWPDALIEPYKDVLDSPADWAKKCVQEFGAELICVKFEGIHPDKGDKDAAHAVKVTEEVLKAAGVPLVLWSCGYDEKDNQVMPKVSGAAKGESCLIGTVTEDNYKSLTAIALADGHFLITEAPLDINIAKQVNILASDMGFPLERIVTFQSTGALGYGIEYAYSIQERQRQAALAGDKMMAMPAICDVGYESWRAKEAKLANAPGWGDRYMSAPSRRRYHSHAPSQSGSCRKELHQRGVAQKVTFRGKARRQPEENGPSHIHREKGRDCYDNNCRTNQWNVYECQASYRGQRQEGHSGIGQKADRGRGYLSGRERGHRRGGPGRGHAVARRNNPGNLLHAAEPRFTENGCDRSRIESHQRRERRDLEFDAPQ